jgi:hypothetical protein
MIWRQVLEQNFLHTIEENQTTALAIPSGSSDGPRLSLQLLVFIDTVGYTPNTAGIRAYHRASTATKTQTEFASIGEVGRLN